MTSLQWMDDGLCRETDPDLFQPDNYSQSQQARKVCEACPVKDPCLEHAVRTKADGIWGGTTRKERQAMKGVAYRRIAS